MIVGLLKDWEDPETGAQGNFWVFQGFSLRSEDMPDHDTKTMVNQTDFQVWFKIFKDKEAFNAEKRELHRMTLSASPSVLAGVSFTFDADENRQWIYTTAPGIFAELENAIGIEE